MKPIYIVGLHRAGTHSNAKAIAEVEELPYLEEGDIKWDNYLAAVGLSRAEIPYWDKNRNLKFAPDPTLDEGFVLQCPGLSYKTLLLSKVGKTYWCRRNHFDAVTSMKNAGLQSMAWHLMRNYRDEFPDDPIWSQLEYDGSEDNHCNWVIYYSLLVKVKEYFYDKYFSDVCELLILEEQSWYKPEKSLAIRKPLRDYDKGKAQEALQQYESVRFH